MTQAASPDVANAWEAEVLAQTQHWLLAAVIGLNLCPFAKAVVVKQRVRYRITDAHEPEAVLALLRDELLHLQAADPAALDTTLLIAPNVLPDFFEFNQFLAECDEVLDALDLVGELQVADFHPRYQFGGTQPDDMGNCTNRAPYPILHLLRESSIDEAVAAFPDAATIFERNIQVLNDLGPEGWQALMHTRPKTD